MKQFGLVGIPKFALALVVLGASAVCAHAVTLIGSQAKLESVFASKSFSETRTVGATTVYAGTEFPTDFDLGPFVAVDILSSKIVFSSSTDLIFSDPGGAIGSGGLEPFGPLRFNGFVLTFANAPDILAAAINGSSTLIPLQFAFTNSTVSINLIGFAPEGARLEIDLTLADVTATPLPAALPLFGSALAGLGLLVWRRKHKCPTTPV